MTINYAEQEAIRADLESPAFKYYDLERDIQHYIDIAPERAFGDLIMLFRKIAKTNNAMLVLDMLETNAANIASLHQDKVLTLKDTRDETDRYVDSILDARELDRAT